MPDQAGSLEALARAVAGSLAPLAQLDVSTAQAVTRELGLTFPPALAGSAGFANTLRSVSQTAGDLPGLMDALSAEIAADNVANIIGAGAALVTAIGRTLEAISTINASIPGFANALIDYLVIRHAESAVPATANVATFFGLIDRRHQPAVAGEPVVVIRRLHFDRLGDVLNDPGQYLESLFGWGDPGFTGTSLFERLSDALVDAPYPVTPATINGQPGLQTLLFDISRLPAGGGAPAGVVLDVHLPIENALELTVPLRRPGWSVHVVAGMKLAADTQIRVRPPAQVDVKPPSVPIEGTLLAEAIGTAVPPDTGVVLFGIAGGSRLQVGGFRAGVGLNLRWDAANSRATAEPAISLALTDGNLHIDTSNGDGFLATLLSGLQVDATFGLGASWSPSAGVQLQGNAGLLIQLPIHVSLGPIEIESVNLGAGLTGGAVALELSGSVRASLGPLMAVVERIGVLGDLSFPPGHDGNAGPVQIDARFKPPNGVGLSIDAGVVKGGGYLFFDFDREEYGGVLELSLAGIVTVKAIGLITTRMPDGTKGFSLLVIITAEFGTGIQLGFGFTLLGVGGLLGLNRTMNLPPLMEGVRTGSINSIMFPDDPVANAPRIISDLRTIFPPYQDRFLIGPMAKLGWGTPTLVSVSLGIVIEISGNIAILGVLKVALPAADAPLILLQVAFAGAIEFDKQRLYFFATLYESRIVFLTLEGDLGLLVAWGGDANFVVSVGGFHPRYNPPPLPFPSPRRIAVSILNTDIARIRTETYFAVTSNSVQFGASTEVMFDVGVARVDGHLSFDALFQFSPFFFVIQISASISLKVFGIGLFSISLDFSLEGPSPYRAHGTGTLSLFFFDVSADFDITWGERKDTTLPPIAVMPLLRGELEKLDTWTVELPPGNGLLVSLRKLPAEEGAHVLHPLGSLRVSQRAVPLDLKIDKVGSQAPSDANHYTVTPVAGLVKVQDTDEQFAKAQFLKMSDAEKLSQRAFDPLHGGVLMSSGGQQLGASKMAKRRVRYEQIIIDSNYLRFKRRFTFVGVRFFEHFFKGSAVAKSELSQHHKTQLDPFVDKVKVKDGAFTVAHTEDNRPYSDQGMHFDSEAQAHQFLSAQVAAHPELHETLHVIPRFEAAA